MLDFARWVAAAMLAFGWGSEDFIAAYMTNRRSAQDLSIEASAVGPFTTELAFFEEKPGAPRGWSGSAGALLAHLNAIADDQTKRRRDWPATPISLSTALRRITPALREGSIIVERERTHQGRKITIRALEGAHRFESRAETEF